MWWPFKKKVVKEIGGPAWGCLLNDYNFDVDTLQNEMRCVEREEKKAGVGKVIHLRIFKPKEAVKKGVEVEGWETFDEHPDLIHFEGYTHTNSSEIQLDAKKYK